MPNATHYVPQTRTRRAMEHFMRALEQSGARFVSIKQLCRDHGFKYDLIRSWMLRFPEFRERVDARVMICQQLAAEDEARELVAHTGAFASLAEPWHRRFLEELRDTRDHYKASAAVEREWWVVEEEIKRVPELAAAYQRVKAEFLVRAKDALMRGAIDGKASQLQAYLEAEEPTRYAKKLKVDHEHKLALGDSASMRPKWREIHARSAARALPPTTDQAEVVEGELVSPP